MLEANHQHTHLFIYVGGTQIVMSPTKSVISSTKSLSTMSPAKSAISPTKSMSAMSPTRSLMSPTKEVEFRIEPSAIFENEYSLGAYIANAEFETTFNNLRKLQSLNLTQMIML